MTRFVLAVALGLACGLALAPWYRWPVCVVAGWDVAALVMIAIHWGLILRNRPGQTRRRAAAEDPGRTLVYAVVLAASTVSLVAATMLARQARSVVPARSDELAMLSVAAVVLAWMLTHTSFSFRYAHLYYREREGVGGLEFPGGLPPADADFAYFAFTIGMCFQVSDVVVTSPLIRRTVLLHALLSFAYNTAILALALNLVFGLVN